MRRGPALGIVPDVSAVPVPNEAERELCERARDGDRDALGRLLRTYGPVLYRSVLLPRLGSEAVAQDALAETFARVVERFPTFVWQGVGVYPWLRVVALRIAIDHLRRRKRETLFEPDDLAQEIDRAEQDPAAFADAMLAERRDREVAKQRVEGALGRIHPRYALAIRRRVLEEKSREEVALELGVTVSTFDVVMHRALASLKKALLPSQPPTGEEESP